MAISLPVDLPANLKSMQPYLEMATDYESKDPCISYWCRLYVLKQGFILKRVEDDLSFLLVLMEVLGKNKQDLQSKIETTDIPVARAHLEGVVQKMLSWAENVPPLKSLTNVVAEAFQSAGMLLDVCSIFGEPNEGQSEKKKYTDPNEENLHNKFHSESTKKKPNIQYKYFGKVSEGPEDPNVWKPKHASKTKEEKENPDKASTEGMLKTVRGILNKLTPSKFEALLARIQALDIDSEDRLAGVIKLFFEKAVDEPIFSSMYAKMCQALSTKEVASAANPAETTNFRKLLLTRCQKEFEKDSAGLVDVENKKKEIENAETEARKKELELELEDLVNANRRKSLGYIKFIGELFKLRILSVKIMHQCILRLLSQPEDEESLECICRLLSTIGKELETPMQVPAGRSTSISTNRETMNSYFSTLDGIVNKRKISNRIRFMIQDVVDLRKTGWKPRREDNRRF